MSSMLRHIARNRAREVMKTKGMSRICSSNRRGSSFFADNWRAFAFPKYIKGGKK